jgi:hypothetical protein
MQRDDFLKHISNRLKGQDFQGAEVHVLENGVRQEENTWYVPLQPSFDPHNTTRYYEVLAGIEADLLIEDGISVLFIPTDPEQRETA